MNCCRKCFDDWFLKQHIEEHGGKGDCDYCGAEGEFVIEVGDLEELFQRFTDLYHVSNYGSGENLDDILKDEWMIFSEELIAARKYTDLLQDIFGANARNEELLDVPDVRDLWEEEYNDLVDRWDGFAEVLKEGGIRKLGDLGTLVGPDADPKVQLDDPFVWVGEDLGHVSKMVPTGTRLFRARLKYRKVDGRYEPLPTDQMGAPPVDGATAGRANPAGTSFLYSAEEEATAITEIRPARGQLVSVATGETTEELNILDFAEKVYFTTPFTSEHLRSLVQSYELFNRWGDDLSTPLRHNDDAKDYHPTQYLAEWVRAHHYDGIRYPSALAPEGHNLVVFDPSKIRFTTTRLVEIKSTNVAFGELEAED